jgi:tetratricopeptide (TPR) repeat protein
MKYFCLRIVAITTFFLNLLFNANAQLLNDPASMALVQKSLDEIYNLEFKEAGTYLQQIKTRYPNHPVNYLLKAHLMYWQYLPIKDNKGKIGEYIQTLNQGLASVEKHFGKNSKDPEAVFYTMVARGYMALMYNNQGELLKAAGEAKNAYNALIAGMKLVDKNRDFYFTTGMYNYYVELYPEDHPIIKPVIIFFKGGNKALGLKQVDVATKTGVITRAEACYYLAHIYLEHESMPEKALPYTTKLVDLYPANPIFRIMHVETLLLAGNYRQGREELSEVQKFTTGFYPIAGLVFEGILHEKSEHNDAKAENCYLKALKIPHDSQYSREYHAMAYAGLARIANREGKKSQAKSYYKKSLEKAEYKSIIREAKAYLK